MKKIITMFLAGILVFGFIFADSASVNAAGKVAPVTVNLQPGSYSQDRWSNRQIYLDSATEGATIYYTTDGSTPTTKSAKVPTRDYYRLTPAIKVGSGSTTIKAMAVKAGMTNSPVSVFKYSVLHRPPTPVNQEGVYIDTCKVAFQKNDSSVVYYTTDGSVPTTKNTKYTAPFTVKETTIVKAIAAEAGYAESPVLTVKYAIMPAPGKQYSTYGSKSLVDSISAIISGMSMTVKGHVSKPSEQWVQVAITRNADGNTAASQEGPVSSGGTYEVTLTLEGMKSDGGYTLKLTTFDAQGGDSVYSSRDISLTSDNSEISFVYPKSYTENYVERMTSQMKRSPSKGLEKSGDPQIKSTAERLVRGIDDPDKKVRAIHDWVTDNVYYNYDNYLNDDTWPRFGSGGTTLETKTGVCAHYAELFCELVRAAGIPCYVITGNASSWGGWGGHAWNEIYLDERWVIIDSTWDSGNSYSQGQYSRSEIRYDYYDISAEELSRDHEWW